MDVDVAYAAIKGILAEAGYKIYTPAWKYCRLKPAFLAVKVGSGKPSACLVKQWKGKLLFGWYQPYGENREITKRLGAEFPKRLVRFRGRLMSRFRDDSWFELYKLVTPLQQEEFKLLTYGDVRQ